MIEVPATSGAPDGDESDFAILFSKSSRPLWLYDPDSLRFIAVNDATVESSGWSREELLTTTLIEVTAPEQKDFCRSPFSNDTGNGAVHPWQHRTKDGSFATAQTYRRSLRYNGKDAVLIVALRSDPASGETELAVPGEQSDFATDAIIIRDFEDRIVFWNKGAERIYGWSAAETIGAKVADFFNNDHANFGDAAGALLSRGRWDSQLDQQRKSGERVSVKTRWALLGGLPAGHRSIIMIDTDLAEAKKLQWQFLRAQRLQAVGTLAGGISHDLNNTLSPVLMSVGVLRQMAKDATTKRMLDIIEASAERSARIVKQVFTFARGIDGEPVLLQPKHLLADLARITTQTFPRNIDVQTDVPSELSTISADATQIHQLLLNLCVNARDAMPNGGTLTISAENVEVDEHFARTNPGAQLGPHVLLRVADTGAGIPPETLRKIFAPFVTTKTAGKGSGLGLAAVMRIVKSHAGFVMVDTEVGAGTTFKVFLPASKDAALPEQKEEGDPIVGGKGELVLIVDDEILIREALVSTLQSNGYHVFTAEDGTDALALYFQRGPEIDLILTDISMGQMDGITLVRSLRRLKSDVPVIVASAQLQKENRAILHGYGVKNFLNKPYTANRLLRELRAVLDGRTAKS